MKMSLFISLSLIIILHDLKAQKIEVIRENESVYLLDKSGIKPQKVQYNNVFMCSFSSNYVVAEKEKLYFVNLATAKIIELAETLDNVRIDSDTCYIEANQYLRFIEKSKTGLMKVPDNIVLAAEYNTIYPEAGSRKFFIVVKGKNWQMYYPQSKKFSIVFQPIQATDLFLDNEMTYLPDDQIVVVKCGEYIHLIKADGTDFMLDKFYTKKKDFAIGGMTMLLSIKDGKYGYIDEFAHIQVPFMYEWAEPMEGRAIVKYKGKYGLLRDDGVLVVPCVYDKLVREKSEFFQATKEGKTIKLFETGSPYDDIQPVEENGKFIFTTEDKTIKIPGSFDAVKPFIYGLAPVKNSLKWGYIIPTGHFVIASQFDDASQFNANGVAAAKINGKWGIIDFTGKFIYEPLFDSIDQQDEYSITLYNKTGIYEFRRDKKLKLVSIRSEKGSFTDSRDGKTYNTVKLASQTWMAQNLNFKTDESWFYENNESNGINNGRLYTWKSALNVCPAGWHLPSDDDWKILEKNLGMPDEELNSTDYTRGALQAEMLQNESDIGFDIQLSGFLHGYDKNFYKLGEVCIIWTSTPNGSEYAYTRSFYPAMNMLSRDNNTYVKYGLPVRCVKN